MLKRDVAESGAQVSGRMFVRQCPWRDRTGAVPDMAALILTREVVRTSGAPGVRRYLAG